MSWADLLTGFGNALPGAARGALDTYAQTQQMDRQKKQDQQALDMKTLKLWADSDEPKLRTLAVIGMQRMSDPSYKPGPKGMINDLTSKDLHAHPEFEQLSKALDITHAMQSAHAPTSETAAAPSPAPPPLPPMGGPDTPEGGSEMALMPGASGGGAGAGAAPMPTPPPMLTPNPPDAGAGPGAAMPGMTYGMPQGSMMTPDKPSTPMMPPPPPTGGAMPGASAPAMSAAPTPAGAAAGPATPPISPVMGVHPELQQMIKDAAGGSAVGDVKAAEDEAKKAFGADILGGLGPRGDAAFKAGANDRIGRKDALRAASAQATAHDKEAAATARSVQSAKDALERVKLRSDSADKRQVKGEELRRGRPTKAREATPINTQAVLVDIERDALKDKADIQKAVDHQLITVRAEAAKNFTSPAQLAQLEQQIKDMGEERMATIESNKEKATQFLGDTLKKQVTAGAPKPLAEKVDKPAGAGGAGGGRTLTAADFPKNAAPGTVFQGYKRVDGGWQKVK